MAWRWTGDKPLPEPMMTQFTIYVALEGDELNCVNKRGPGSFLGPFWSPWINFNPSMDKVWDEITYPFPNVRGATIEIWEWISNFINE